MEKWLGYYQAIAADKRILGTVIGVLFGLLYLIFGLLKTLGFLFFVAAGYYIGRLIENREDWRDVIERILPQNFRE